MHKREKKMETVMPGSHVNNFNVGMFDGSVRNSESLCGTMEEQRIRFYNGFLSFSLEEKGKGIN